MTRLFGVGAKGGLGSFHSVFHSISPPTGGLGRRRNSHNSFIFQWILPYY